jgi:AcrR family transcriptional regulator
LRSSTTVFPKKGWGTVVVFARRGYQAAKLEEIAADAGLSTGAIYSNFTGKENLFLALADAQVDPGAVPDELFAFLDSSLATAIFAAATPRPPPT